MLEGKRLLITGVITRHSIAFAVAREAQLAGAEVVLTGFGRGRRLTERPAKRLPGAARRARARRQPRGRSGGGGGGARLALGRARRRPARDRARARGRDRWRASWTTGYESAALAFRTSAYSLQALARHLAPLLERADRAAIVGLDFDASVAWPAYDWMGVAKAALESTARYLARDLGPRGIRVNLVSAGPVETAAAGGIPGLQRARRAPGRSGRPWAGTAADPTPVAQAVCFLLSDWSEAISGEVLHVDGGFHALGAAALGNGAVEPATAGQSKSS